MVCDFVSVVILLSVRASILGNFVLLYHRCKITKIKGKEKEKIAFYSEFEKKYVILTHQFNRFLIFTRVQAHNKHYVMDDSGSLYPSHKSAPCANCTELNG